MKNYIKSKNSNKFFIGRIKVEIKTPIEKISNAVIKKTITNTLDRIPEHLLRNINTINVGVFEALKSRELQALYKNSNIFLNNEYQDPYDMVDDLVHEVAHSVEEIYYKEIYEDKIVKKEFLEKRKQLWQTLKDKGIELELLSFLNHKYDEKFDLMIYKKIGYPVLATLASNIFYSPYAATSLSEYFANGFEAFFMKEDIKRLKKVSPKLYIKIINLLDTKKKG